MIDVTPASTRKGIILAGGLGTRLYPLTRVISKQLLPVYEKPMIYYPLTTLMMAGVRDILIIAMPNSIPQFKALLGDGAAWGLQLEYLPQPAANGIAEAFLIGEGFIGNRPVVLSLGDNIFYGENLPVFLQGISANTGSATIFGYPVADPTQFGVVTLDGDGAPISIEEKPKSPTSKLAVPGLYFYDSDVVELAKRIKPDARGELQVTDINKAYLAENRLRVEVLSRGWAWLDSGSHDSLLDAGNFARLIEKRTGLKIACPEEVAFRMGYIDAAAIERLADAAPTPAYGQYLRDVVKWG